jgi:hypothetical protein
MTIANIDTAAYPRLSSSGEALEGKVFVACLPLPEARHSPVERRLVTDRWL